MRSLRFVKIFALTQKFSTNRRAVALGQNDSVGRANALGQYDKKWANAFLIARNTPPYTSPLPSIEGSGEVLLVITPQKTYSPTLKGGGIHKEFGDNFTALSPMKKLNP